MMDKFRITSPQHLVQVNLFLSVMPHQAFLIKIRLIAAKAESLYYNQYRLTLGQQLSSDWQARTVGPGTSPRDTTFVIPNHTVDMKLEANIEYRFDIIWKVDGAVFIDAGNVWTLKHKDTPANDPAIFRWNTLAESIAANWGVGVRLNFGFLLLRVDMGMKIHDPSRVEKWVNPGQWLKRDNFALHFGVGYPF